MDKKRLAIIPARSGSKGLKDKNIKPLNGKPLMAYSIEAALASGVFDEVMVSTESEKYAGIAKEYGASVPILRSAEFATDKVDARGAVLEVLDHYEKNGRTFDSLCILQPTSPLRRAQDIIDAYKLFEEKATISVISVCPAEHPIQWYGQLKEENSLDGFISKDYNRKNRQDLRPYHRLNGAIYIYDIQEFKNETFAYQEGSYAYVMDPEFSVDIDTIDDFEYAEFLLKKRDDRS